MAYVTIISGTESKFKTNPNFLMSSISLNFTALGLCSP